MLGYPLVAIPIKRLGTHRDWACVDVVVARTAGDVYVTTARKNHTNRNSAIRISGTVTTYSRSCQWARPILVTYQPGWGWRSEGRAMNPSRRTASQADDDLNIDTRTMYSSDCTLVLSQANTLSTFIIRVSLDKVESGSPNLKTAHAGGEHKENPSPSTEGRNVADAERSC